MANDKLETFPEEKIVNPAGKEHQMSVEETLRSCAHVKRVTKDRGGWRFLTGPEVTPESIRELYKASANAPAFQNVLNDKAQWAVWVGEGAPEPAEGPFAVETQANGTSWPEKKVQELTELAEKIVERATWRYTACTPETTESEIREKLSVDKYAPVRFHADGDLAAAWFGGGTPTRPAFPDHVDNVHKTMAMAEAAGIRSNPGLAGRDGLRLLKLSRNKAFSKKIRALLERVALKLLEK